MASIRCTDVQARPTEFLDVTSVTLAEFQQLVPPFEAAYHAHLAAWRLDGKPRTARRFTVYKNCPLPTPEDRLFFMLVSLKTSALQVVQGRLFGMGQSTAHQWMHVLLPALLAALRALGDAPARSLTALAQRLGVAEADAATVVVPLEEEPAPVAPVPAAALASSLVPMTGPNGASSAPKTLLNRSRVRAARTKTTPSTMSCWSMPCSRSFFSVRRLEAASLRSALLTRRPLLYPPGASCCRIWASWRAHSPTWRASCRPSNPVARS
jgi:DDE superfamily endonuclease